MEDRLRLDEEKERLGLRAAGERPTLERDLLEYERAEKERLLDGRLDREMDRLGRENDRLDPREKLRLARADDPLRLPMLDRDPELRRTSLAAASATNMPMVPRHNTTSRNRRRPLPHIRLIMVQSSQMNSAIRVLHRSGNSTRPAHPIIGNSLGLCIVYSS
jgi:hypothetical protein